MDLKYKKILTDIFIQKFTHPPLHVPLNKPVAVDKCQSHGHFILIKYRMENDMANWELWDVSDPTPAMIQLPPLECNSVCDWLLFPEPVAGCPRLQPTLAV